MFLFLLIMATGFALGWALRARTRLIGRLGALTRPVIFALLFLMGISIGLDDHTMRNLGTLGLSSLGFAVLTIAGSMAVLALLLPWLRHMTPRSPATSAEVQAEAAFVADAEREGEAFVK